MKAFSVHPARELYSSELTSESSRKVIDLITDNVLETIKDWEDLFFVDFESMEEKDLLDELTGTPKVHWVENEGHLRNLIRASVDPNDPSNFKIRSLYTCRAVVFGFDGQALLCLRHDDRAPSTVGGEGEIVVKERNDLLSDSDFFDG